MDSLKHNWEAVLATIKHYENQYHRAPHSVSLLAVSKKQSFKSIEYLYTLGQKAFGESYLQEELTKINALPEKSIEWHFIGPIQRNKTKKITEHFQWVHSVSNQDIAQRLNDQRPSHLPPLNVCLQVNVSQEQTKSGIAASLLIELATFTADLPLLKLRGLMAIPAISTSFEEQRTSFRQLRVLFEELNQNNFKLDTLSMGMSGDMEAAIAEGASLVRIGTALFQT